MTPKDPAYEAGARELQNGFMHAVADVFMIGTGERAHIATMLSTIIVRSRSRDGDRAG